MPDIKVIIGICAYNVETYVEECIRSAIGQTYKNIQIVVIDDGSTDKTPELIDKAAATDPRITVFHVKNEGHAAERERIVNMLRDGTLEGDAIYWLDSDDYLFPDAVKRNVELMTETGADIVKTPVKPMDAKYAGIYTREEYLHILLPDTMIKANVIGCLFRKEVYEGVHHRIGFTNEDYYIIPFLVNNAKKIVVDHEMNYGYRAVRPGSITYEGRMTFKGFYPRAMHREVRYNMFKDEFPEECRVVLTQFVDHACMCGVYAEPKDAPKLARVKLCMQTMRDYVMNSKDVSLYKKWLYDKVLEDSFFLGPLSVIHKIRGRIRTERNRRRGRG